MNTISDLQCSQRTTMISWATMLRTQTLTPRESIISVTWPLKNSHSEREASSTIQQTRLTSLLIEQLPQLMLKLIGTKQEPWPELKIKVNVDHVGLSHQLVLLKVSIRLRMETCQSSQNNNSLIAPSCKEVISDVEVDGHMLPCNMQLELL